jgi:hypothetical protein
MATFTDLAAIALAISQDRLELQQNAADQAALQQVARSRRATPRRRTSSTRWSPRRPVSWASGSRRCCASADGATEVVALHDPPEGVTVGMRASGEGNGATQRVWRTGRAARVDRLAEAGGRWPQVAASRGFSSSAARRSSAEIGCGASSWRPASVRYHRASRSTDQLRAPRGNGDFGGRGACGRARPRRRAGRAAAGCGACRRRCEPQRILEAVVVETSGGWVVPRPR